MDSLSLSLCVGVDRYGTADVADSVGAEVGPLRDGMVLTRAMLPLLLRQTVLRVGRRLETAVNGLPMHDRQKKIDWILARCVGVLVLVYRLVQLVI